MLHCVFTLTAKEKSDFKTVLWWLFLFPSHPLNLKSFPAYSFLELQLEPVAGGLELGDP